MDEVENFFVVNFQILGPLGCQGWVVIPQNVKKSQNHCTLLAMWWTTQNRPYERGLKTETLETIILYFYRWLAISLFPSANTAIMANPFLLGVWSFFSLYDKRRLWPQYTSNLLTVLTTAEKMWPSWLFFVFYFLLQPRISYNLGSLEFGSLSDVT